MKVLEEAPNLMGTVVGVPQLNESLAGSSQLVIVLDEFPNSRMGVLESSYSVKTLESAPNSM